MMVCGWVIKMSHMPSPLLMKCICQCTIVLNIPGNPPECSAGEPNIVWQHNLYINLMALLDQSAAMRGLPEL